MNNESLFVFSAPSAFGPIDIIWEKRGNNSLKILRIFLTNKETRSREFAEAVFPGLVPSSHPSITTLGETIRSFLNGENVLFTLDDIDLDRCSPFQRRVILAEYDIPRGWVSTYGRIGKHLGKKNASRAVGGALARNPFPIVIPCHRAVRANFELGGYQGGIKMKQMLLELEGVDVSESGKVSSPRVYY